MFRENGKFRYRTAGMDGRIVVLRTELLRMKTNYILLAGFLFFILLTLVGLPVPFFWDVTYFSHQASDFYLKGYTFTPLSPDIDTGGFPLYSTWMFCCWKLFGRTLLVSHLALLPFLLGIVYEYLRLAGKYLSRQILPFALLLLCAEPAFLTQSLLMAYDLLGIYFFLAALNALLEKRMLIFSVMIVFLGFTNMRGIFAVGAIGIIHGLLIYRQGRLRAGVLLYYTPFIVAVTAWAIFHHRHTGWYFFSPVREHAEEHLLRFGEMIRQFVFLIWKLVDSGRIFLWVVLGAGMFSFFKKGFRSREFRYLLAFLFIPLGVLMGLMVPIANPSSARYLMIVNICLCLAVCFILQQMRVRSRRWVMVLLLGGLVSGNFWIYPERFSNGWDTSLKVMPYFKLKREMIEFLKIQNIPPEEVGTQFPLIDNQNLTDLNGQDYQFTNALDGPLNRFHYYLHSNVCNTDLLPQIEQIKPTWKVLKQMKEGQVYMTLYENPAFDFAQTPGY